ncbi:hypothetical protein K4F52_004589 [Lecanicillium sp. MT-2017a]|nr:hypothetical protein K4F52_004589 [Lecanicillium sp. MT-2017a]
MDDFITSVFTQRSYKREDMLTFAIYQRQQAKSEPIRVNEEGTVAGMVSLVNVDPLNRSAEIGILQVLSSHRSREIATKTGRLLVWHALQPTEQGGLGLVRLEWRVATGNEASERVAKNLGFNDTGLIKYERLLKNGIARGKVGNNRVKPPGTMEGDVWRDVKIYSISWDEWPEKPEDDEYRTSDVIVDND